jgi:hypothetical protein
MTKATAAPGKALLTSVAEKSFSGLVFEKVKDAFPDAGVIDRTSMNTWADVGMQS